MIILIFFRIMNKKKCSFNSDWVNEKINPDWSKVFASVEKDVFRARCKLCNKCIDLSNMGKQALISHEKSQSHKNKIKMIFQNNKIIFNINQINKIQVNERAQSNTESISTTSTATIEQRQSNISNFILGSHVSNKL